MLSKFSSPQDQATARAYLDQIHARDFSAVERDIDPSLQTPGLRDMLEKMAGLPPVGEPTSVKIVGAQRTQMPGEVTVNTTFEYEFAGRWFIENLAIKTKNGTKTIVGLHVSPEKASLEALNHFTLSGKSAAQYAALTSAIVAALLTIYAAGRCIGTKNLKRKWLWIIFILVGFGAWSTDWTSGEIGFNLLSLQLLSAGASSQFYGPWIITAGLPVGAILFLLRGIRRRHPAG
jgi:hypothetical protein